MPCTRRQAVRDLSQSSGSRRAIRGSPWRSARTGGITTAVMDTYIKRAVRTFAPNTPAGELKKYTSHSFRVGALQRCSGC